MSALKAWSTLERALEARSPDALSNLNTPASDADIQDLETRLQLSLPADFLACYRIHNGQRSRARSFFQGFDWLSLRHIGLDWSAWEGLRKSGDFDGNPSRPDSQIREGWWRSGWVPFATDGGGTHLCIDLDPAASGSKGQVIKVFHDMPHRQYVAADFGNWLALQVESITHGL